jgi:large subunit ribosomal protein L3
MSHGSKCHRLPGSIGAGTTPGRVFKGLKMAGRMGNKKITVKNLKVVAVDPENNLLILQGAVPGKEGSLLEIRSV